MVYLVLSLLIIVCFIMFLIGSFYRDFWGNEELGIRAEGIDRS